MTNRRSSKLQLPLALILFALLLVACASQPSLSTETRLSQAIGDLLDEYKLPGITVAISRPSGVTAIAAGFADREHNRVMTTDTTMLAASIGKTFVAATILQLVEEERVGLDDPISRWLQHREWFEDLPNADTITVRHLLQHTSGLPDHVHMEAFLELGLERAAELGPEGLIALILGTDPLFAAGTGWSYSDTAYLLLGLIVEAESGRSYYALVQSRFLTPLGLTGTGPSDRKALPNLARGYVSPESGMGLPPTTTDDEGYMRWDPSVEWTGGGFYSTSSDLATWGRALLSGNMFTAPVFIQAIEGTPTSVEDLNSLYGLGMSIRTASNGGQVIGHRGWIPGYVSSLQYYPDRDTAIAFQTNTDIGIIDSSEPVVLVIEERLAAAVFGDGR